jgi:uncharacterized membrane protein HdeD (DUF308 family)
LALRGVLAILFGMVAFFWPGLAWLVVVYLFAAYAFVDGVFAILAALAGHARGRRWWGLLLEGVAGIGFGALTLLWPLATVITELALLYLIAFWSIATGVFEVAAAIRLRHEIQGEWALALSGILSILFGLVLIIVPAAGALAVAWLVGAYAIAFGVLLLVVAFRLRTWGRQFSPPGAMNRV